jgi:Tol biopolymer transport system component
MQIQSHPFKPARTYHQLSRTEGEAMNPVVSPDGKTVVYAGGTSQPLIRELYSVGIDGESQVQLTDRRVNLSWQPAISPDGDKIAYAVEKQGRTDLHVMNLDGTGNKNITNTNKGYWHPSWSPDGEWLATTSRDTSRGNLEIVLVATDGSGTEQVTNLGLDTDMPVFAPDGAHIVFGLAPGFAAPVLASIKRDGTGFRTYANHLGLMSKPTVAEDGRIVFSGAAQNGRTGIYQVELNGDPEPKLLIDTRTAFSPQFSPDGKRLAYTASTNQGYHIFEANSDGTNPVAITSGNSFNSAAAYVGDGKSIVYTSSKGGDKEVYRADLRP